MNILVLAERFPNRVQPWLLNWLVASVKQGCSVNILAEGKLGDTWQNEVEAYGFLSKTEYYPIGTFKDIFKLLLPYIFPLKGRTFRAYKGLGRIIKHGKPEIESVRELVRLAAMSSALIPGDYDIIHSHTLGMSYQFLFLKKTLGVPMVTTFHGLPPLGVKLLKHSKMQKVFNSGELFLVNTNFAKRQLLSLGCQQEKIQILPQGINLGEFPFFEKECPGNKRIIIITVGRFHKDKGHVYAIEAVSDLIKEGYDIEYRIIGVGPEKVNFIDLVNRENLNGRVHILESLDDASLRQQYKQAHIFILPSVRATDGFHEETQGVVLQEAQASGVIVVATKTGGIPECVIDNENAFLVADRDAGEIADKIRFIISHAELWGGWQRSARDHVEKNFAIDVLGERMQAVYKSLISGNGNI